MANYMGNSPSYSLMDDMEFKNSFSNQPQQSRMSDMNEEPLMSQSTVSAGVKGAQAGGLSGALMAGGVNSLLTSGAAAGGPYAIAGGLLLSELQAAQEAKAQEQAQRMKNETDRNSNMQSQLNSMSRSVFKI